MLIFLLLYSSINFLFLAIAFYFFFFFNDTATTEIYTLSLHDALPIGDRGVVDPDPLEGLGCREHPHRPEHLAAPEGSAVACEGAVADGRRRGGAEPLEREPEVERADGQPRVAEGVRDVEVLDRVGV